MAGEISRSNGKLGGRPKGSPNEATKQKQEIRKKLLVWIYENQERVIETLSKDASGVKYMIDQVLGKPKESVQISGDDENPVRILEIGLYERKRNPSEDDADSAAT